MKQTRIIHRFWATHRKLLDKNRLDLMVSRLRFRQSNRKREIETRCHLSRLLVSETRHVKHGDCLYKEPWTGRAVSHLTLDVDPSTS